MIAMQPYPPAPTRMTLAASWTAFDLLDHVAALQPARLIDLSQTTGIPRQPFIGCSSS